MVEELGENAQQGGAGHYIIAVSEDTYNALSVLRAWFARASGRDVTFEDVIGALITYWALRQTR